MKSIFCVTLTLILHNCIVQSGAMDKTFEMSNGDDHIKKDFANLNEDCLFLILEKLDFVDLLSVALINNRFSTLAADVYRRELSHIPVRVDEHVKFSEKLGELLTGVKIDSDTIERINRDYSHLFDKRPNIRMNKYPDSTELADYETIWNTFRHFGREIKIINCGSFKPWLSWQSELIGYLIGEYSSESLVDFRYSEIDSYVLYRITKPLINVEDVTFGNYNKGSATQITRFHDLFPAVRRLYLINYPGDNADFSAFDFHMPHLEHVTWSQFYGWSIFPVFFKKNPQIKSIDWNFGDPEFLKNTNTLLPQLESLKLSHYALRNGSICFENVTAFDTGFRDCTSPANLYFPRLKTLRTNYVEGRLGEYLAFLNEHQHLIHLHLTGNSLSKLRLNQLTENLNDLMEITFEHEGKEHWAHKLSPNDIVEFLKIHDKVKQLNVINFPPNHKIELREQLKHEWNTKTDGKCLSFERK